MRRGSKLFRRRITQALTTGKKSDILLTNGPTHLLVETTLMRMSVHERKALAFFHRLAQHLDHLGWHYGVRISGSLKGASPENAEALAQWLQAIEEAAHATAHDGRNPEDASEDDGEAG